MSNLHVRLLLRKAWVLFLLVMGVPVSLQTGFGAGSKSTEKDAVTPTWHPQLHGEKVSYDGTRYGFEPYGGDTGSTPPRYLTRKEQCWLPTGSWITDITTIDEKTGEPTSSTETGDVLAIEALSDYFDSLENYGDDWETFINTYFNSGTFWMGWGDRNGETVYKFCELSDPYTPEKFVSNVEEWIPPFPIPSTFTRDVNAAYLQLPSDKLTYKLQKLQYKWDVGGQTGTVVWDEQFTPDNGGPVQHHIMTWRGSGESPVFSLDPATHPTVDNSTNPPQTVTMQTGTYQVIVRPVEIKTSSKPYSPSSSTFVGPVSNLLAAWAGDSISLRVDLGNIFTETTLPAGSVEWSVPGQTIDVNKLNATVSWASTGIRRVKITTFSVQYSVFIDVPNVGTFGEIAAAAMNPLGAAVALLYAKDAEDWAAFAFNGDATGPANAIQHSYWNSLMASDDFLGPEGALFFSTAHEFSNKSSGHGLAYDSTMDLHNNYIGASVVYASILGFPKIQPIRTALANKLKNGDLWIVEYQQGILHVIKSNGDRIFSTD